MADRPRPSRARLRASCLAGANTHRKRHNDGRIPQRHRRREVQRETPRWREIQRALPAKAPGMDYPSVGRLSAAVSDWSVGHSTFCLYPRIPIYYPSIWSSQPGHLLAPVLALLVQLHTVWPRLRPQGLKILPKLALFTRPFFRLGGGERGRATAARRAGEDENVVRARKNG